MSDDILDSAKRREGGSHADPTRKGPGTACYTQPVFVEVISENWPRCIDLQCSSPLRFGLLTVSSRAKSSRPLAQRLIRISVSFRKILQLALLFTLIKASCIFALLCLI